MILLLLLAASLFTAVVTYAIGNMVGTALLKARGVGLISFRQTAAPGRWRAPLARLAGPLLGYLVAGVGWIYWMHFPENIDLRLEPLLESPALAAGLQVGDRAVELDGAPLSSFVQLEAGLKGVKPGQTVELVVLRGTERVPLRLTANAQGRLGLNPCTQFVVHSYGEGLVRVLVMPSAGVVLPAERLIRRLRGEPPPPSMPMPKDKALREERAYGFAGLILTDAWALFLLLAIATQLAGWIRGELRAGGAT